MALAPVPRARLHATLACAGTLVLGWRFGGPLTTALATLAALLAVLAWASPRHYAPVQRTLDRATHALLVVITWTALGLIYFGVFTPLRLWRALTRHDPLTLRRPPRVATYLRAIPPTPLRFDRQF